MKMKKFGLFETKLFHFHRMGRSEVNPPEPSLDPPLVIVTTNANGQKTAILMAILVGYRHMWTKPIFDIVQEID